MSLEGLGCGDNSNPVKMFTFCKLMVQEQWEGRSLNGLMLKKT